MQFCFHARPVNDNLSRRNLLRNSFLYEACVEWVESLANMPERCLGAISETAALAWQHHPGRFADGALENCAFRIGREHDLPRPAGTPLQWSSRRLSRTLHVASELHPIGGHTRILAKWIECDATTNHAVLVTRQRNPVPVFFERAVARAGGTIVPLAPSESALTRAALLRDMAVHVDRVVLHHHPDDPIPIVAFAGHGGPPVAMFNHAHFGFSLGPAVSDLVVNTLDYFREISERFRFARRTTCLSGVPGSTRVARDPIDKALAKESIGIDSSIAVVLSTGHESYFAPNGDYDFFRTARKLLSENRGIHLFVVGVRAESPLVPRDLRRESRCHFMGPVTDPLLYYRAADVCLESFPMPSLAAVIEAVAYGEAFPIPVYGAAQSVLRVSLSPVLNYRYRPRDEDDYLTYISEILSHLPRAREEARNARLAMIEASGEWEPRLAELNRRIDQLKHEPAEIPRSSMNDSDDSRELAALRPLDMGEQIDRLLPFTRATKTHIAAVRRGLEQPRALAWIGRLAWRAPRGCIKRLASFLPEKYQRDLERCWNRVRMTIGPPR
jgi:hypothetical protein